MALRRPESGPSFSSAWSRVEMTSGSVTSASSAKLGARQHGGTVQVPDVRYRHRPSLLRQYTSGR